MILIFGGAYQGKLDYARENFEIETVSDCREGKTPDFAKDTIYGIEGFVMECTRRDEEAREYFEAREEEWKDAIIIATDTSQGVVPIDKTQRDFREMNGRLLLYLAGKADRVIRVFCGIGKDVK